MIKYSEWLFFWLCKFLHFDSKKVIFVNYFGYSIFASFDLMIIKTIWNTSYNRIICGWDINKDVEKQNFTKKFIT